MKENTSPPVKRPLTATLIAVALVGLGLTLLAPYLPWTGSRLPQPEPSAEGARARGVESAEVSEQQARTGPTPEQSVRRRAAALPPRALSFQFGRLKTSELQDALQARPFPVADDLHGSVTLTLESPVSGLLELQVADGRARFEPSESNLPAEWSDLLGAEASAIRFRSEGLFRAHARDQVLEVASVREGELAGTFNVSLHERSGWPIEVVSSTPNQLSDDQIEVRLSKSSRWLAPATLSPPRSAEPLDLPARDGLIELPAPTNPDAIYWIGAPDHAWRALRWSRRAEVGRVVVLEPFAIVTLNPAPALMGRTAVLALDHPTRMWGERPLWSRELTIQQGREVPIPPGRHLLSIRGGSLEADLADLPLLLPRTRVFAPGSRQVIDLRDPGVSRTVTVRIRHGIDDQGFRWALHYLGDGTPGPPPTAGPAPFEDDLSSPVRTLSWSALRAGYYAIAIDGRFALAFEQSLDAESQTLDFDISESVAADVYLPQRRDLAESTIDNAPDDPRAIWVSVVMGDIEDWPSIPIQPLLQPQHSARIISVTGPLGATLRVSYADPLGIEGTTMTLDGESYLEVPLRARSLITWDEDSPRPPLGWQAGVEFRGRDGARIDSPPVVVVDSMGIAAVGTDSDEARSIYLPAYAEAPSLGRWVDLAPAPFTVSYDAIGEPLSPRGDRR